MLATHWNATRFVLKHVVATAVVIAGSGVLAATGWIVGDVWAVMTHGSEPTLGFLPTVSGALVAGAATAALVLLPATALAELTAVRAGFRTWRQVPIAALIIAAIGILTTLVSVAGNQAPLTSSLTLALAVTARRLVALVVYWWALQSTDWLLRSTVRVAGRLWPSRFAAAARAQESPALGVPRSLARFRIQEHFTFDGGPTPVLVITGDVLDGVVRDGMHACATVGSKQFSARIQSVQHTDSIGDRPFKVGLLLPLNEQDLRTWRAAAVEGSVLRIG